MQILPPYTPPVSSPRQALMDELQVTLTQAIAEGILVQQAVADRLGLGLADFKGFTALLERGSATAGELVQRTGLTSGAVTRMIDRLERAGWVRRVHDTVDRRRVIVEPVQQRLREVEPLFAGMAAGW